MTVIMSLRPRVDYLSYQVNFTNVINDFFLIFVSSQKRVGQFDCTGKYDLGQVVLPCYQLDIWTKIRIFCKTLDITLNRKLAKLDIERKHDEIHNTVRYDGKSL